MKRLITIMALFSTLLLSCVKQPESVIAEPEPLPFEFDENLQNIDTLLQSDATTALQELLSFDTLNAIFNENYHQLLLSEALYKTDNPQYYRIELQAAMHYFDSLAAQYPADDDLAILAARSHYMNGIGFYESDSIVEACKEYLHTLEIMENHFDVDILMGYKAKFMGLTYTRLGEVFLNNGIAQPAIEFYQKALNCFEKLQNFSLANTYRGIGNSYRLDNNNDSALYYCRKALSIAHNNDFVYSSLLSEFAPVYYEFSYTDSAFVMLETALSIPMDAEQRLAQYYTYGLLLTKEHQYDSAIVYLEKSVKRNSYTTQTASAELLMNCYEALGDTISYKHYKEIYGGNFTQYRNSAIIKSELTKIYQNYKQEQEQKENLIISKKRNRRTILVCIIVLAVTICVFVNKRKDYKTIVTSSKKIVEKEKALEEMKRKIESNPFMNESICKHILSIFNEHHFKSKVDFRNYREFALSKEQMLALRDAVDRHYDGFTQRLQKDYPELSYDDINYCCLYLLGVKDADISALMQKDYSTICRRRRKISSLINMDKILVSNGNTTI